MTPPNYTQDDSTSNYKAAEKSRFIFPHGVYGFLAIPLTLSVETDVITPLPSLKLGDFKHKLCQVST